MKMKRDADLAYEAATLWLREYVIELLDDFRLRSRDCFPPVHGLSSGPGPGQTPTAMKWCSKPATDD